jgi:hypothetical protein
MISEAPVTIALKRSEQMAGASWRALFPLAMILSVVASSHADPLRDFLSSPGVASVAGGDKVLILEAQSASNIPAADVNWFDDFFLINASGTLVVNFDRAYFIKGQKKIQRWLGPEIFSNTAIPPIDLQEGFNEVRQHFALGAANAAHVSIFQPLVPNSSIIFDYVIAADNTGSTCREFLYITASKSFQTGSSATKCQWTLQQFGIATRHPK